MAMSPEGAYTSDRFAEECTALAPLRQKHADLFTPVTDTMRSFFAQPDHLGILNYVIDCLDFMDI